MKRSTLFLLLISSTSLIGTGNPLLLGREPKQSATIVQREGFQSLDLDQKLSQIAARKNLPGFAVAVVSQNEVLFQKGYGLSDIERKVPYGPQSLQNVASVSKTLIGISLMQLVEQGKIKLDDDINTYLPFKVINPYFPEDRITIRHLATHTSTLKDTNDFWLKDYVVADPTQLSRHGMSKAPVLKAGNTRMPMGQFIKNLVAKEGAWYRKSNFLKQKPGTTFEYSNLGAGLAGYIVERVTGETLAEYSEKHILRPIGMTHSGWSFDKVSMDRFVSEYGPGMKLLPRYSLITYPDGGFISSIEDISKYVMEMIKGYQGESTLMRQDSFREMMRLQSNNNSGMGYGIFCAVWRNGYIGHSGGDPGTTTRIFFDPKTNTGTAMFINTTTRDRKGNPVAQDFSDIQKALGWP